MNPEANISISREGQELGTWNAGDVRKMLAAGVLVPTDHFWQEGMADWDTLAAFAPPSPSATRPPPPQDQPVYRPAAEATVPADLAVQSFSIAFGSALALDPFGFVGSGELRLGGDKVEFVGRRQWPGWARAGVFLVATPVGWWLLGAITGALPRDGGALLHWLAVCLWLFTLVGTPLLVLTLMPFLCASATTLAVHRSAISGVSRRGHGVTLQVSFSTGKPRQSRFRAKNDSEAGTLVRLVQNPGATATLIRSP